MKGQFTKESVIGLLLEKAEMLKRSGEDRFPQRSDFSEEEVCAIKAFLGPWPRALETAGIKAPREEKRGLTWAEKRIRNKQKSRTMDQENGKECHDKEEKS